MRNRKHNTTERRASFTRNSEQICVRVPHELRSEIANFTKQRGLSRTDVLLAGARLIMEANSMLATAK